MAITAAMARKTRLKPLKSTMRVIGPSPSIRMRSGDPGR